jgi:hypothetical protein
VLDEGILAGKPPEIIMVFPNCGRSTMYQDRGDVREYHEALTAAGVLHSYFEVEELDHNQRKMIDARKATWFDFQIESLKLNQLPLRYLNQ